VSRRENNPTSTIGDKMPSCNKKASKSEGKGFASPTAGLMNTEVYTPREIAVATGVSEEQVAAALGSASPKYVLHAEAVRIGRMLAAGRMLPVAAPEPLFRIFSQNPAASRASPLPLAVSSTLHVLVVIVVFITTFNLAPRAATLMPDARPADPMRLVFVATPGPGGGGGGGGLRQKAPAPKAMREGRRAISSPIPERRPPDPIVSQPIRPEPKPEPPLKAEPLPVVVAPIVTAPADNRSRAGVLEQTTVENESHGPGVGGGAGTGTGTGLGRGEGPGVGEGSGGGTGGGPYRPGSGIDPPRLLREVRADYTEDARRRGLNGEVVLEIVVRRDGSVGEVRILQGLGGGLNDRAVEAVRQWRFSPAQRHGAPVDVIVEVAVEFRLR
jgi:periplasmic protein TonB